MEDINYCFIRNFRKACSMIWRWRWILVLKLKIAVYVENGIRNELFGRSKSVSGFHWRYFTFICSSFWCIRILCHIPAVYGFLSHNFHHSWVGRWCFVDLVLVGVTIKEKFQYAASAIYQGTMASMITEGVKRAEVLVTTSSGNGDGFNKMRPLHG